MLIIQMAALVALSLSSGQAAQTAPTPTTAPVAPASDTAAETRRVCRFETVTGSNRRTRVCRDVARNDVQDQQTREFLRNSQRVRLPDGG